jgi:hypothetical protein
VIDLPKYFTWGVTMRMPALGSFLARLLLWLIATLPFATLPLLINALIWAIVHGVTVWPLFQIEDLSYFAIFISGQTMLGLLVQARLRREIKPLLLVLPLMVALGSAILLGHWHSATADPGAHGPFTPTVLRLVAIGKVLATAAFGSSVLLLFTDQSEVETVSRLDVWFSGRMLFAFFPCLVNGFFALLTPTAYQVWRVNDLCFFSIAISGPAIIDIIHSAAESVITRAMWSVTLVITIISSSVILGCWYFAAALPAEPAVDSRVVSALLRSSQMCAIFAAGVAGLVEMYVRRHARSATDAKAGSAQEAAT